MNSKVAAFPLSRRRKLVSGIANVLRSKQGEMATLFWRQTAQGLLRELAANEIDLAAAEVEVRNLLYAVLAEIEAHAVSAKA